jgi:tRNA 2-thiouridine synthesizing protein C
MANDTLKKSVTFISRHAPYGVNNARLTLDMALASAVFGQNVSYVFMQDGIYQLLKNQHADGIHSKTLGKALETLSLYGIDEVCVDAESLAERNIQSSELIKDVQLVSRVEIAKLIDEADAVFNL